MKRLESLTRLTDEDFRKLIESKRSFALYVRSQRDYERIKEIFDTDVVFPELAKAFGDRLEFFWCDIDEVSLADMGIHFAPVVALFKEGKLLKKLEGIKSWAEYNRAVGEFLC